MRYVKFMPGRKLDFASRNKRELQVAQEFGFDIFVVSSDDNSQFSMHYPSYHLTNDSTLKLDYGMNPLIRAFIILFINPFKVTSALRSVKGDIVSCHDIDSLLFCWLAYLLSFSKPKFIYDSHEFEIGRNTSRNRLQKWFIIHMERFLIKRCAFSIMVNDVIADEVQHIHGLEERPIVVRSIPNYWNIDQDICSDTRTELMNSMESPQKMLLMYHGGVLRGRGVEKLLEVVSKCSYTCAVILGNGEKKYIESLHKLAEDLRVSERVLFHEAVPIEELWKYVGAADVGMVTVPAASKSYYYMLPNKFFENIQSETPVICSNFPAVAEIVEKYRIGLLCNPSETDEIISCVEKMYSDKELYRLYKENLKKAKEDLCWENEKNRLKSIFAKL